MNSGPHLRIIIPPAIMTTEQPRRRLRLKLKPKAPATGYVDGAWWPRSRDLSAELPALLAVLAIRLGRVLRVSYNLTGWDAAPRRITVDGQPVRLGGFHSQANDTMDVIGPNEPRITLLVIPPQTRPEAAHQVLLRASRRGNIDNLGELLAPTARTAPVPDTDQPPWRLDGGRGYDPTVMYRIPRQR
ncbi:DUF5994 family protein [Actinophytocola sp.]|uniref:DUF5994 family protein n=1 Tax=Actinophytocola sp. TaxID=1872138 RepID=UPI002D7F1388|nr:DUF5994 family protein [Actinophytocola sp.]HET9140378.1 DUF5994 family protein [Actinophytocola sp.]